MSNGQQDVLGQMLAVGLDTPPMPLDTSGKVRRFGPKKAHWYRLREMRTDSGTWVVVGSFGNHRGQERWRVEVDWKGIVEDERQALLQRRQAQADADRAQREIEAQRAAMTAADLWASASRTGTSEYLKRKGVDAEACRYLPDGSIVIPLLRYDHPREQALKATQRIWPDGTKRFSKGFQKPGVCLRLGLVVAGEPLLICEGYATGLTLRMAVQRRLPVFVALDAGNLLPVAELLRALYPDNRILMCADDDYRTKGNPGRDKAVAAAKAVGRADYIYPIFRPANRREKDTDFNDLQAREGLNCVRRQLRPAMPALMASVMATVQAADAAQAAPLENKHARAC
ncbi:MAG: toprim domain-containing protein [Hydrogenophaga sp.]|uniref:toprim domain-containing protein n=1 Tax=Hydrogenophaga sp. TaxID=1904254 RepID=UPI003D9BF994